MLEDQAVGGFLPDSADSPSIPEAPPPGPEEAPPPPHGSSSAPEWPASHPGVLPAPDPSVADSARLRLATHRALSARLPAERGAARPAEDFDAINAVIDAARGDAERPVDALDIGASLVVLCDLRLYLDGLEADLLDAAGPAGLGWDVIAAIIGIPADEARRRHHALRARRVSP
jgi:hypothetical protein